MRNAEKYRRERAWILKKINKGVPQSELLESVGIFSNRKKKRVMESKGISSKQYEKRKEFCHPSVLQAALLTDALI